MKHILSFLWSHCLNKKVIFDSLGKSSGGWEPALGQWACYDNEYPAITTTTSATTTSLRWGRHGTFAFGRCRFGHLHMTANRGKGDAQALWRWRVGATTFRGTQRCCKCSSRSSTASAVSQFVRTSRLTRRSPSLAHVFSEIINGYNHELSQAPSRSCATPWPTVPLSPCPTFWVLHELSFTCNCS